jgi:hypothetical protein
MAALSWDEICERAKQNNKTVICEVEKRGKNRLFKIKCNICMFDIVKTLSNFKCCKYCSGNNKSTKEEFTKKAKNKHGDKYDYSLLEYVNSVTKVKIKCNSCNTIFQQQASSHLNGRGCRKCYFQKYTSNVEEFILKADIKHSRKYDYSLVEYINTETKVKIKCNSCDTIFQQKPNSHLNGRGCPKCNESKGENRVAKYLTENDISFIPQKTFKTLRDKNPLFPDFYLEHFNLLIEYDGEFHYRALIGSTPEIKQKNLEIQQSRDKIKNEWALKNNIPLLRIPYWDFDRIEELIEAFILEHRSKKELVLEI